MSGNFRQEVDQMKYDMDQMRLEMGKMRRERVIVE
jgi:hypothetical protein